MHFIDLETQSAWQRHSNSTATGLGYGYGEAKIMVIKTWLMCGEVYTSKIYLLGSETDGGYGEKDTYPTPAPEECL